MKDLRSKLDGKKTYIGIALGIAYSLAIYVRPELDNQLVWTAIAGYTGISARLAIGKVK